MTDLNPTIEKGFKAFTSEGEKPSTEDQSFKDELQKALEDINSAREKDRAMALRGDKELGSWFAMGMHASHLRTALQYDRAHPFKQHTANESVRRAVATTQSAGSSFTPAVARRAHTRSYKNRH